MKPFDLQEALNGAPVRLRNGDKAVIGYIIRGEVMANGGSLHYPVVGHVVNKDDLYVERMNWTMSGEYNASKESNYDVIGMWEEPEPTPEQVLEKAYQENLPLDAIGKKAFVIAKTKDGDYVMQCGEDNLYFASHETEWKFYKDPAPKSDTITVTLPKPFKPKQRETYYSITQYSEGVDTMHANRLDHGSILNGNCFRTKSDAQAWLDAMKNALEG